MPINQSVLSDKYDTIAKQRAYTEKIEKLEKELVKLNDIPSFRRPVGFDTMKRDIVNEIKTTKEHLSKEAKIGRLLTRQLGLPPEQQPTEHTMRLLGNAERLGVTEPTRGYLDEHSQVLPPRHANLPHQLKMILPRPNPSADALGNIQEFERRMNPTSK